MGQGMDLLGMRYCHKGSHGKSSMDGVGKANEGGQGTMKYRLLAIIAIASASSGCTDSERSRLGSYGSQARITCFSGGVVIREYMSTGKVQQNRAGGLDFKDVKTGKFARTFADCFVEEI
jgi:hypothetical protein